MQLRNIVKQLRCKFKTRNHSTKEILILKKRHFLRKKEPQSLKSYVKILVC